MESWKALLQKHILDRRRWATRHKLHPAIVFWIERTDKRHAFTGGCVRTSGAVSVRQGAA